MRRSARRSRLFVLAVFIAICVGLISLSVAGILTPLEELAATPLNWVSGVFNRLGLVISGSAEELQTIEELQQRNAELEQAIALLQEEVVAQREIVVDYNRLAEAVGYVSSVQNLETIMADVIGRDTAPSLRTIVINRGSRDGIREGMAVLAESNLVGRVIAVGPTSARVMLITSDDSYISARLQTTRDEGTVHGISETTMQMEMLDLNATVQNADLVITSGLGGNLPADLTIGQVISTQRLEAGTQQTAQIRSLVDFSRLEMVLVVTSFEPVDQSIFEQTQATTIAP
jgi:rod shape-determining protein MreC